ncbi:MAG: nitrate reductase, partial [Pseudomonadota bacterium]
MSSTQSIRTIKTTCPYCGVGCGVKATVSASGAVRIAGDEDHPSNFGRLCSKGSALADVLVPEGRLRMPQIGGQDVSWDAALHAVASRFKAVIAEHGPDATAFYVSGQLLTEDYYIANKLMKGYIGSANIDTNSRLCMASSVAGHKRAFGEDIVPGTYEDFDHADLVVLTGSNFAWCHPVLHQRLMAAKAARPELMIVAIDPRKTATTQQADMHLDLAPGSDVALFQGLLRWLSDNGHDDSGFIAGHTQGLSKALAACDDFSIAQVARRTQLPAHTLAQFYALFAKTEKTVTVYSQGVNQAADGTDRVGAIINCHLFTGRIGRPGMGPFSITGQPNAMGGREVGGLANQLACHMDLENPRHRATARAFWGAPHMPGKAGLKAVDLFDAVASGKVKAIWIMATNPVDSLPNADKVRRALETCETVVVSDVTTDTDTAKLADILLPAMAWGEKNGTVTNSERRISRQRRLKNATGEARADWDIMCDVARRMGWSEAFDFSSEVEIFREYAAMTAFDNDGSRGLDLSALADVTAEAYDALEPVQWPVVKGKAPGGRLFENGGFYTPSRRANFIVPAQAAAQPRTLDLPFTLNTGRIRDQWHSMTRTGLSATLSQHLAEPFVEIHPEDARQAGIKDASLAEISSRTGSVIVRALVTPRQRRGSVFVPMHWTDQFASNGRVDA